MPTVKVEYPFLHNTIRTRESPNGQKRTFIEVPLEDLPVAPWHANIRNPDPRSRPYKEILKCGEDPKKTRLFYDKSHGIRVAVKSTQIIGSKIVAEIDDSNVRYGGVFDGNHTQHAIAMMQEAIKNYPGLEVGTVEVSFFENYPREEILDLAVAAGQVRGHKMADIKDAYGDYAKIWKHLPPAAQKVIYHRTGDVGADGKKCYNAREVILRMAVLSDALFPHDQNKHPDHVYDQPSKIERAYDEGFLDPMLPLIPDILALDELIALTFIMHHGLQSKGATARVLRAPGPKSKLLRINGSRVRYDVPKGFMYPVLSAFRLLIVNGKWKKGWDLEKAFFHYADVLVSEAIELYRRDYVRKPAGKKSGNKEEPTNINTFGRSSAAYRHITELVQYKDKFNTAKKTTNMIVAERKAVSVEGKNALAQILAHFKQQT